MKAPFIGRIPAEKVENAEGYGIEIEIEIGIGIGIGKIEEIEEIDEIDEIEEIGEIDKIDKIDEIDEIEEIGIGNRVMDATAPSAGGFPDPDGGSDYLIGRPLVCA
ncbi:MAG: hypothetical protein PHG55_01300 [Verrucomicrobiota bacterium]|nr:hypothetical protein [Verrucomicrobiota bacterium]